MAVIVCGQHFVFNLVFEPFEIDDETCDRVRIAGNRYFEGVVVAVSVAASAAAKPETT